VTHTVATVIHEHSDTDLTRASDTQLTGEQFQREKRTLFARSWLPFCADAQIPMPGTYVSHTIGGWPLFVIRGDDKLPRAFRNSCRHQHMPLLSDGSGACDQLRCRFHSWVYDRRGHFVSAPSSVFPTTSSPDATSLEMVQTVVEGGIIFVRIENADSEGPPNMGFAGAEFVSARTADVATNWKTLVESFLSEGSWYYEWPLAFVRHSGPGPLLRQIVPRAYQRTRVVDLAFGPRGSQAETDGDVATEIKQIAACYQATAADRLPTAVLRFRHVLAEICEG
jgi:nitrite reductase/ring-hydroxylating ferredoxin subunit